MSMTFGCTNYRLMASEIPSIVPGGAPTSIAALMVHDEIIAEGQASSSKNAKVKASSNAVKMLGNMMPIEYRMLYGCSCDGEEKQWVGKDGNGVGMVGTAI
jgi:endoribonuclease Dicer